MVSDFKYKIMNLIKTKKNIVNKHMSKMCMVVERDQGN